MNSTPSFFPSSTTSSSSSSSALNKETEMENECKWDQRALMSELTEGLELTKQLNTHLINLSASSSSSSLLPAQQFHLLQKILSSYQKALLILQPQTVVPLLQSYSSPNASPHPHHPDHHHQHSTSKKRKVSSSSSSSSAWRSQVRIRSENGLESPSEDGYSWRKYGQKDILAAKYPRSYYRCTYRNVQGCWATKQVQRSDEDPSLFDITYKGKHTCNLHRSLPVSSPATPQMQEINHHHHHMQQQQQQQINNETLLNLRNNLRVDTDNNEQMREVHFPLPSTSFDPFATFFAEDNLLSGFSSSSIKFLSPDTSEYSNNYLQTNSCERNGFGWFNDLSEIISANTSVTNSPVVGYDLDFSNEPARLGSFAFDDDQIPDFSANNCNWN